MHLLPDRSCTRHGESIVNSITNKAEIGLSWVVVGGQVSTKQTDEREKRCEGRVPGDVSMCDVGLVLKGDQVGFPEGDV